MRLFLLFFIISYLLIISFLFYFFPEWDLKISSFFWQQGGFIYLNPPWVDWVNSLRKFLNVLIWSIGILSFLGLVLSFVIKINLKNFRKICLYILLCFVLAPGLIVNMVLKNHWGQPRPIQIQEFSGHLTYQKDWVMSKQCPTNCAFVCGDCAGAFILMAFVPLLNQRRKTMWASASFIILFSGLIGLIRLGQGGHFLSDVLLAYGIDGLVIWGAYLGLIYKKPHF